MLHDGLSISPDCARLPPSSSPQMHVLLRKFNLAYWRSPSYNFVRLLVTLLVSLLYGTTYYQRGQVSSPATLGNIQNVVRP